MRQRSFYISTSQKIVVESFPVRDFLFFKVCLVITFTPNAQPRSQTPNDELQFDENMLNELRGCS